MWTRHSETWPKCMIHPCKLCIYFVNRNITNTVPSLTTLSDSPIKEVLCSSVASLSAWVLVCFVFVFQNFHLTLIWLMAEMGKRMGLVADVKGTRARNKSLEI